METLIKGGECFVAFMHRHRHHAHQHEAAKVRGANSVRLTEGDGGNYLDTRVEGRAQWRRAARLQEPEPSLRSPQPPRPSPSVFSTRFSYTQR